jgi:hypothetical protein
MQELKQERIEKGELVAAVDEMLALQSLSAATPAPTASSSTDSVSVSATPAAAKQRALSSAVEDLRRSIARPTGLRAPSSSLNGGLAAPSESRIGKSLSSSSTAASAATSAGVPTPARSLSGGLGKSRMLASIERMGRTGSGGSASGVQE